jgi:hypothetical protein
MKMGIAAVLTLCVAAPQGRAMRQVIRKVDEENNRLVHLYRCIIAPLSDELYAGREQGKRKSSLAAVLQDRPTTTSYTRQAQRCAAERRSRAEAMLAALRGEHPIFACSQPKIIQMAIWLDMFQVLDKYPEKTVAKRWEETTLDDAAELAEWIHAADEAMGQGYCMAATRLVRYAAELAELKRLMSEVEDAKTKIIARGAAELRGHLEMMEKGTRSVMTILAGQLWRRGPVPADDEPCRDSFSDIVGMVSTIVNTIAEAVTEHDHPQQPTRP